MVRFLRSPARVPIVLVLCLALGISQISAQSGPPAGSPPSGSPPSGSPPGAGGASTENPALTTTCGETLVDGVSAEFDAGSSFDSSAADTSALCVINGGTLTLEDATVTKTGDTSSGDQSSFYGLNAAVLVGSGSTVSLTGGSILANGAGANGVFSTGEGTVVTLSDLTIEAYGDGAHAVMATLGGALVMTGVDVNTTDVHSGAIATDRGSGTITYSDGTITTSGSDSPGIYSTGVIEVANADVSSSGAEVVVIEGSNSVTLTDSTLVSSFPDKWGVMLYQSFSGDAEGGEGVFTMTGGSLAYTSETGPLFFVTNSTGTITLSDVTLEAGSGILGDAHATERWGTEGSNGGHLVLIADNQQLTGDFVADAVSSLDLTLSNGSSLTGAINAEDSAQTANLTLDASSTWSVTADSHLTTLTGALISDGAITNVTGNGYTVTYDAASNPDLNGLTYSLQGGGVLQPA